MPAPVRKFTQPANGFQYEPSQTYAYGQLYGSPYSYQHNTFVKPNDQSYSRMTENPYNQVSYPSPVAVGFGGSMTGGYYIGQMHEIDRPVPKKYVWTKSCAPRCVRKPYRQVAFQCNPLTGLSMGQVKSIYFSTIQPFK